jgi:hypothetical protein
MRIQIFWEKLLKQWDCPMDAYIPISARLVGHWLRFEDREANSSLDGSALTSYVVPTFVISPPVPAHELEQISDTSTINEDMRAWLWRIHVTL